MQNRERLKLELEGRTEGGWCTRSIAVSVYAPGWTRSLRLTRSAGNHWHADVTTHGETVGARAGLAEPATVEGALDCDLGLCPLTNTMPIRRLGLTDAPVAERELVMAWIEVPSLRVVRSEQVYGSGGPGRVAYRSRNRDFHAELTVDDDGLVIDYPGLARRILV